jgi:hypothetical protein
MPVAAGVGAVDKILALGTPIHLAPIRGVRQWAISHSVSRWLGGMRSPYVASYAGPYSWKMSANSSISELRWVT